MAGADRRRHIRARCCFPCELAIGGSKVSGEVRNVSAGGLGVLTGAPAIEQGESIAVFLRAPGVRPFGISALVWHVREVRRGEAGKTIRSWGLVLGEESPAFARLVEKLTSGRRPAQAARPPRAEPGRQPAPAPRASPPPPPSSPPLGQFAIRIRQVGGPRTVRVVACGANEAEAVEAALLEVGDGWALLDACALS